MAHTPYVLKSIDIGIGDTGPYLLDIRLIPKCAVSSTTSKDYKLPHGLTLLHFLYFYRQERRNSRKHTPKTVENTKRADKTNKQKPSLPSLIPYNLGYSLHSSCHLSIVSSEWPPDLMKVLQFVNNNVTAPFQMTSICQY